MTTNDGTRVPETNGWVWDDAYRTYRPTRTGDSPRPARRPDPDPDILNRIQVTTAGHWLDTLAATPGITPLTAAEIRQRIWPNRTIPQQERRVCDQDGCLNLLHFVTEVTA